MGAIIPCDLDRLYAMAGTLRDLALTAEAQDDREETVLSGVVANLMDTASDLAGLLQLRRENAPRIAAEQRADMRIGERLEDRAFGGVL